MSVQLIELMFFAAIAFFLFNKLISILGNTNENDGQAQDRSFFGEVGGLKDVTEKPVNLKLVKKDDFAEIISAEHLKTVLQNLEVVSQRIANFNIEKFVAGSKTAFAMLIEAAASNDADTINSLVDKRFAQQFQDSASRYNDGAPDNIDAKILELYMFGNNAFIKLLFSNGSFKEEWTFTKNTNDRSLNWFVSNIDVA